MQNTIQIIGQIGSGIDDQGNYVRGVELVDVIAQFRAMDESQKEVTIEINSPGGFVETGNDIYNYIEAKKKEGYKIKTIQKGIVGSIATKIFLAGDERIVNESEQFFIHNPLVENVTGDAIVMQRVADRLQKSKNELLSFYMGKTGNNREALEPLMDSETALSAEQAVQLGFATEKFSDLKIYASIKTKKMDFKEVMNEFTAALKAMIPAAPAPVKAMEMKLADGKVVVSDAADAGSLVGSSLTMDGAPLPDGEYALADGQLLEVEGGKVMEVKAAPLPVPAPMNFVTQEQFKAFADTITASLKAFTDANSAELVNIKNNISSKHIPAKKKENASRPIGGELAKEWDELFRKDGALLALKRDNQKRYAELYEAKYGTQPEL